MAQELWRLTLHYFGHLMRRTDSLGKTLMLGSLRAEVNGATEDEMAGITDSMDMSLSKLREMGEDRGAWCAAVHGLTKRHA